MCVTYRRIQKDEVVEKSFAERVAEAKAEVPAISPQAAKEARDRDPATVFIDPRHAAGIASTTGIIPGALNVPLATLSGDSEGDLPAELESRERPIITACERGPMGALAAHALKSRGYTNVRFIDGGTQGWLDAGYATDR
jgi:rhodanese-related sulfurtransferase